MMIDTYTDTYISLNAILIFLYFPHFDLSCMLIDSFVSSLDPSVNLYK